MGVAIVRWDAETAASQLRNRRRVRIAWGIAIGIVIVLTLVDHFLSRNYFGDDWARFDGREFRFVRLIDGDSMAVCEPSSGEIIDVKLMGIRPFHAPLEKRMVDVADAQLVGKMIVLHLGLTRTRDERGRLVADAMTEDGKPISALLATQGLALADRRSSSAFVGEAVRGQSQARKKRVGMWGE
jgi:hypothetical protein